MNEKFEIRYEPPSVEEFIALRDKVGWGEIDASLASISLRNTLFHVVVRERERLVGMARVVGDGAMYFYVQDVVVTPECQGQGIGDVLMKEVETYLDSVASKGATVGLFSAVGKETFYLRYGYDRRTGIALGVGMSKFV